MYDFVAQLVEHFPFKEGVLGSNPNKITSKKIFKSFSFLLLFSCSPEKSNRIQLSGGVFDENKSLSCAYLEETRGKEVDKKIDDWVNEQKVFKRSEPKN